MSPPPFDRQAFLGHLPQQPGVYRMYDAEDTLIYIGKAKNLRNRVRSYFHSGPASPKVQVMVAQIARMDYVVTDSEIEALILETNLIKRHKPKYNILMKDDKKHPWIGISDEAFPRIFITRNPEKRGKTRYFGPYLNSNDLYAILQVVRKHFPLRQRRKPLFKHRPCMNYSIGTCSGPCQNLITPADYQAIVRQVILLLKGKNEELLEILHQEMAAASEALAFERAAKLRDRAAAVEHVMVRQKMVTDDVTVNQDVLAAVADDLRCMMVVLSVRRGKLIGSRAFELPLAHGATLAEAYDAFITPYYADLDLGDLPEEIILQFPLEDEALVQAWLSQRHGRKVTLTHPQKGTKKEMLDLGVKNAQEALEQSKLYDASRLRHDPTRALMALQDALGLPDFPARMECYDISHFQGSQTVASMVVFTDGRPDPSAYRRFKIESAEGKPDDFKSMAEVIRRRFHRATEDGWEPPDLLIIDGGKGQLNAALASLEAQGLGEQATVSLAKRLEEVFVPGRERPIILPRESPALFLLQQIRDEAHRFAITYHRTLRGKAATTSLLDRVPGIGPKRRQQLLQHFGSVEGVLDASLEALTKALQGEGKLALKLHGQFRQLKEEMASPS